MFYRHRSLPRILAEGTRLYFRHFAALSKPLLYPLVAQLGGIVLWVSLTYESIEVISQYFSHLNIWLIWLIFVLANLPGLLLFCNGCWEYLIWISALNLPIRDWCDDPGATPDIPAAEFKIKLRAPDYSLIWSFLFAVFFIPIGLAFLPISLSAFFPQLAPFSIPLCIGLMLVVMIVEFFLSIFLGLVFQVFAFTPASAGACLIRSADLTVRGIPKVMVLITLMIGITQFVVPGLISWLMEASHLMFLIASSLEGTVRYVLQSNSENLNFFQKDYPWVVSLYKFLISNPKELTLEIVRSLLYTFVSGLLLPWGTCWFALLYADLKLSLDESKAQADSGVLHVADTRLH